MGSNSAKAYGAVGRDDVLLFPPEAITLVTDPNHPLYDPRVHMPLDLALVASIKKKGVTDPIKIRKNGEVKGVAIIECMDGRQRVRAALKANEELAADGSAVRVRVPAIRKRCSDAEALAFTMSSFIRQGQALLESARMVERYIGMGHTEKEASVESGLTLSQVRMRRSLLDAAPEVHAAIEAKRLSATNAAKLTKLPREEQVRQLPSLLKDDGAESTTEKVQRAVAKNAGPPRARMVGRKKLATLLDRIDCAPDSPSAGAVLRFVLGDGNALEARWVEGL